MRVSGSPWAGHALALALTASAAGGAFKMGQLLEQGAKGEQKWAQTLPAPRFTAPAAIDGPASRPLLTPAAPSDSLSHWSAPPAPAISAPTAAPPAAPKAVSAMGQLRTAARLSRAARGAASDETAAARATAAFGGWESGDGRVVGGPAGAAGVGTKGVASGGPIADGCTGASCAPPAADHKNATPWQGLLTAAQLLLLVGGLLLGAIALLGKNPASKHIAVMLAWLAAACGTAAAGLGLMIAGYGQTMQGAMLALSGGIIAGTAVMTALSGEKQKDHKEPVTKGTEAEDKALGDSKLKGDAFKDPAANADPKDMLADNGNEGERMAAAKTEGGAWQDANGNWHMEDGSVYRANGDSLVQTNKGVSYYNQQTGEWTNLGRNTNLTPEGDVVYQARATVDANGIQGNPYGETAKTWDSSVPLKGYDPSQPGVAVPSKMVTSGFIDPGADAMVTNPTNGQSVDANVFDTGSTTSQAEVNPQTANDLGFGVTHHDAALNAPNDQQFQITIKNPWNPDGGTAPTGGGGA